MDILSANPKNGLGILLQAQSHQLVHLQPALISNLAFHPSKRFHRIPQKVNLKRTIAFSLVFFIVDTVGIFSVVVFAMNRITVYGDGEALDQVGERIRSERLRQNLPQSMLARTAGVSRVTIAKVENGDGTVSLGTFARICAVLGFANRLAEVIPPPPPPINFAALMKPERERAFRRKKHA